MFTGTEDMKYLVNDAVICESEFNKVYILSKENVYEVVRIVNGEILFLEDHIVRLKNSLFLINKSYDINKVIEGIKTIVKENEIVNGNVKIEISFRESDCDLYIYPISFYYSDTKIGVDVVTASLERINPRVKSYDGDFKKRTLDIIESKGVYEVIMVNPYGFITEGSRTNVYFVKGKSFFTAPEDMVLSGVTRLKVNKIIEDLGFEIFYESVHIDDIFNFDGCFLTSTSSNVLPVKTINNVGVASCGNFYISLVRELFEKNLK